MAVLTNIKSAPAINGQSAVVTLSGAESVTYLGALTEGQLCTVGSSSKTGSISSIDELGHSFEVAPVMSNTRFDSTTTPGILLLDETVTV